MNSTPLTELGRQLIKNDPAAASSLMLRALEGYFTNNPDITVGLEPMEDEQTLEDLRTLVTAYHQHESKQLEPGPCSVYYGLMRLFDAMPANSTRLANSKLFILNTIANGWGPTESGGASVEIFGFFLKYVGNGTKNISNKIQSVMRQRLEKFSARDIDHWISRTNENTPQAIARLLDNGQLRKHKEHLRLLGNLDPEECNVAATELMPRYGTELAKLDRDIDRLRNLLGIGPLGKNNTVVDWELTYCDGANPLDRISATLCVHFGDISEDQAKQYFAEARTLITGFMEHMDLQFPLCLKPRGGPDNLAWGLKDWKWEPPKSSEAEELERHRFARHLNTSIIGADFFAKFDLINHNIQVTVVPEQSEYDEENIEDRIKRAAKEILESSPLQKVRIAAFIREGWNDIKHISTFTVEK